MPSIPAGHRRRRNAACHCQGIIARRPRKASSISALCITHAHWDEAGAGRKPAKATASRRPGAGRSARCSSGPTGCSRPRTGLPVSPLSPGLGWCDAPGDANYNRLVRLPYAASHERLWRSDGLYDLVAVLGYNDSPRSQGRGSAIFLHLAHSDYRPTEGCVAIAREHMLALLARLGPGDELIIE